MHVFITQSIDCTRDRDQCWNYSKPASRREDPGTESYQYADKERLELIDAARRLECCKKYYGAMFHPIMQVVKSCENNTKVPI